MAANGDGLRIESFTGCCGVDARLDVLATTFDARFVEKKVPLPPRWVLDDLATGSAAQDAELVSALLAWEPVVDVAELARQAGLQPERVRCVDRVGAGGQIGYDLADGAYLHRSLPYATGDAESSIPRLRGARVLVAEGAVRLDGALALVGKGDHAYMVR
jgi:hypothetical protein